MTLIAVFTWQMLSAQDFEYSWQRVRMDSAYESDTVYGVDSIVGADDSAHGSGDIFLGGDKGR